MMRRSLLFVVLAFSLVLVMMACGGRGGQSISISPSEVTLEPGESQVFTATVMGESRPAFEWSASAGELVPSGHTALYTAPAEPGEHLVTARSARDRGRWASAVVTVAASDVVSGMVVLRYSGLPSDGFSVLELRLVADAGPVVRRDVRGPSGELELKLPAGSYEGVLSDVVAGAAVGAGRGLFSAIGGSPFSVVVGVGERVVREAEFMEVGEVAENVRMVRGADLAAVESITGSTVRFAGRPAVLVGIESGDVLWFEFDADADLVSLLGSSGVMRADGGWWAGVVQAWEDFREVAARVPHVVIEVIEDATGVDVRTVPASLANVVTRVDIDWPLSIPSLPLVLPEGEALPWDGVSGALTLTDVEARLVLKAHRVVTLPRTYDGLDARYRPLAKPESLCVLGATSSGWAYLGLNACSLWLVIDEFVLEVEIGTFDLNVSLDFPFDSLTAVPLTVPLFHIGVAALAANLELDVGMGLPLVSVTARQPVSFRTAYLNPGDGGDFVEDDSSTPIKVTVAPFGGEQSIDLTVDAVLSLALALTDPTLHIQAFGRVGGGPELKLMAGRGDLHRDVWPWTVSAVGKVGGGLRAVKPDRTTADWWVHSWGLFRLPMFGSAKFEFEGIDALPHGSSLWMQELPSGQPREVAAPYMLIAPGAEHAVWLAPGGPLVPDPDTCELLMGEAGDASLIFGAVGVEQVCTIRVAEPADPGNVVASVLDAVTAAPIDDVMIGVCAADGVCYSPAFVERGPGGSYTFELAPGDGYEITFGRLGYLSATYANVSVSANESTFLQQLLLIDEAYDIPANASGRITNALTGAGVAGAELRLRAGFGTTTGPVIGTATTDAAGGFAFTNLDAGYYSAQVTRTGYVTATFSLTVVGGQANANQNFSITPELSDDEIRIVLTWGVYPADLDSHLTGPRVDHATERFHVAYFSRTYDHDGRTYAQLDHDVRSSYGPETVTIYEQVPGLYRYSVHDYTNRGSSYSTGLANSGAQVRLYRGASLLREFSVPSRDGTLWTVFELDGASLTPINAMSYEASPVSVQRVGLVTDAASIRNSPPK